MTTDPVSSELIDQARADLDAGHAERARAALAEHVVDHYDVDALDLLGEILHGEGDLAGAGAMWFATKRRGEDVVEAQRAWREQFQDDFGALWASLPPAVREDSPLPRVDALRRKAIETGAPPPTAFEERRDPEPEPAGDAAAGPAAEAETDPVAEAETDPAEAANDPAAPARTAGPAYERVTVLERIDPHEDRGPERHRVPAAALAEAALDDDPAQGSAPELTPGRPARALPSFSSGKAAAGKAKERLGGGGGKVDSATIIAAVLAVLAVICMIVGLVTILGWIIPG